jgi:hypothetical protein
VTFLPSKDLDPEARKARQPLGVVSLDEHLSAKCACSMILSGRLHQSGSSIFSARRRKPKW